MRRWLEVARGQPFPDAAEDAAAALPEAAAAAGGGRAACTKDAQLLEIMKAHRLCKADGGPPSLLLHMACRQFSRYILFKELPSYRGYTCQIE